MNLRELAKSALGSTPIGPYISYRRRLKSVVTNWTSDDEKAAIFYRTIIRSGDLCFDVGANIGNRTKIFRRIGARVLAIEPQRHCVRVLRKRFSADPEVQIIRCALGASNDTAVLRIASSDTVSSLSDDWIGKVSRSGRFGSEIKWARTEECVLTTLDNLITKVGAPDFVKIDVEGYESEVLKGLSTPVRCVSFEFTPEHVNDSLCCIFSLNRLGFSKFNFSEGETMEFVQQQWMPLGRIIPLLESYCQGPKSNVFGDVYAARS